MKDYIFSGICKAYGRKEALKISVHIPQNIQKRRLAAPVESQYPHKTPGRYLQGYIPQYSAIFA